MTQEPNATVNSDMSFLRVRSTPELKADKSNVLFTIPNNSRIRVVDRAAGWARLRLGAGGLEGLYENTANPVYAYCASSLIKFDDYVPPVASPVSAVKESTLIGFNALGDMRSVESAIDAGCQTFIILDNFLFATQIKQKHPGMDILVRRVQGTRQGLTLDQRLGLLELGGTPSLPAAIYTWENESDNGYEIYNRYSDELPMAKWCNDHGIRFCGGNYSVGNPDFTRPDICKALSDTYAVAYNEGTMDFGYHSYAPDETCIDDPMRAQWYMTRCGFLFTECGFRLDGAGKIRHTEAFVDKGGVGGAAQLGYSGERAVDYWRKFLALHHQPWTSPISGRVIPYVPVKSVNIFLIGRPQNWAGYWSEQFIQPLSDAGLFAEQPYQAAARSVAVSEPDGWRRNFPPDWQIKK